MMRSGSLLRFALWMGMALLLVVTAPAATISKTTRKSNRAPSESPKVRKRITRLRHSRRVIARRSRYRRYHRSYERFYTSSYSDNVTAGDVTAGEDPIVREAGVAALENMNGTVLAIDPQSGRVLAMVNQKLALAGGAEPCSTIKLAVALAALNEGIIEKDTQLRLGRRSRMNLTEALAHSNNYFFARLGERLGFETVSRYAHEFGLGELAGYNIEGEHLGTFPEQVIPASHGGIGKMTSFGEGISLTPLQLGALVSAIANGGTLYYLQHPTTPEEMTNFQPRVKRQLNIGALIPQMTDGMMGAVDYGTARSLRWNFSEEDVLGKTGTCSQNGTRFGWFASYARSELRPIVVVVFLQGGRPTFGPKAAEIAGRMYRQLYDHQFFAAGPATAEGRKPPPAVSTQ